MAQTEDRNDAVVVTSGTIMLLNSNDEVISTGKFSPINEGMI